MPQNKPTEFNAEVCNALNYYVYRLIDPRDGSTFYVGKGSGNRVFEHARGAHSLLSSQIEIEDENDEDSISLKMQTINDICKDDLEVIHVIHRHGMDEQTAFAVEATLIDAYPGLTNIASGHGDDYGCMNTAEIVRKYSLETIQTIDEKILIIKIRNQTVEDRMNEEGIDANNRTAGIYAAVHREWKLARWHAEESEYVIASIDGIVKGVFKPIEWYEVRKRLAFKGEKAPIDIWQKYVGKLIPVEYRSGKGKANPCLYTW